MPVNAVSTGTNWSQVAKALREGCINAIAQMTFGEESQEFKLKDVPFPVWISRHEDKYNPACYVMRQAPSNLKAQLEDNMASAIRSKKERNQLASYRSQGMPTLLLLDSDDIALVNRNSLAEAFRRAADRESPEGFDEVFIAQSGRDPIWFYPVKLYGRMYPNLPEFQRFFEAQYVLIYGKPR